MPVPQGNLEARETRHLIAADKVEGTTVYNRAGEKLGSIESVVIDKVSGKVAYAVLSFGGFLGIGDSHYPLPWGMLKYDTNLGGYVVDCPTRERLGYGGDAGTSIETGLFNFDTGGLYSNWAGNWRDSQAPNGDVPYTAPNYPDQGGGGPMWSGFDTALSTGPSPAAKKFVFDSSVVVRCPGGRFATVPVAPSTSANAISAPPFTRPERFRCLAPTGSSATMRFLLTLTSRTPMFCAMPPCSTTSCARL